MKGSIVSALFLAIICFQKGFCQYQCYSCNGGPNSRCGTVGVRQVGRPCTDNYCYEAYILYQNGAMPIVQRRCWQKPNNTEETNFCKWVKTSRSIKNSQATVVDCKTCNTKLCNIDLRFWES